MKEHEVLRVPPNEEQETIEMMERRGFALESSQEVYNEQEVVVGAKTEYREYGDFMRGFTGNDGTSKTTVQTQTKVTHFIVMRFSREKDTINHAKIVETEREIFDLECYEEKTRFGKLRGFGVFLTIIGAIGTFFMGGTVLANMNNMSHSGMPAVITAAIISMIALVLGIVFIIVGGIIIGKKNAEIEDDNFRARQEYNRKLDLLFKKLDRLVATDAPKNKFVD